MDSYHVLELAGEGSYGRVYKGRKKYSGQVVALKFMPKVGRSEKELRNLKREIEIMRDLQHPNIVQLFDSFETATEVVVVTEYAEGQLFQILEDDGSLPECQVREIACQLVSALYYLHSHRILHRDMKPQNILLGKSGVVKLCDFGFARAMSVSTLVLTSIKGTPLYMSPELVGEMPYDHTADLWSLGCILYELHTGVPPFYTNSIFHLVQMIVRDPVKWPPTMSDNCMSFLKGLLTKDPQKRLSWPDLLHHPFVEDGVQVFSDSTVFNPLTEMPSPDMVALKLQQVALKTPRVTGESRLLQKACEKTKEKKEIQNKCGHSKTAVKQSTFRQTKLPPLEKDLKTSNTNSQVGGHQKSKYRSQISRDYAQEFPSVESSPQSVQRCFEERRPSLHAQFRKPDAEDLWEKLLSDVGQCRLEVLRHNDLIPRVKSTFLAFKTQLKSGTVIEPLEIHQPLKLLNSLIHSDQKDTYDLCLQIGLPYSLFDLIYAIVENPNIAKLPWSIPALGEMFDLLLIFWGRHCDWAEEEYSQLEDHSKMFITVLNQPKLRTLAPLAASVLAIFIQHGVTVDADVDTLISLLRDLWEMNEDLIPLPAGWGMFDGILALFLHTLSECDSGQGSLRLDPDLFLDLWISVGVSLGRTPPSTDHYSANGIYSFLSLALLVFIQDPNSCIPVFSDTSSKCVCTLALLLKPDCLGLFVEDCPHRLETDWSLDSLSVLSCHLLCFPFALDVPALTMSRILDLYVSSSVIAGLLQVIQTLTPSLLELPLSLLSRLLLCDPERSLSCLGNSAGNFFIPYRDNRLSVSTDTRDRTAMSLLSDLMQSDVLWEAAVELLTVLSQVAQCSPQLHLEVSVLCRALTHTQEQVREATCRLLANMQTSNTNALSIMKSVIFQFIHCLRDPSMSVRRMACRAVGSWLGGLAEAGYKSSESSNKKGFGLWTKENSKTKSNQQAECVPLAEQEDEENWTEAMRSCTALLGATLLDPDTKSRHHCCVALGNLVKLEGAVQWVLEEDVSSALLRAACMDSHHTVRQAAISSLCMFSQQEPIRQALMSLDAKRKLLQASRAFPQSHYEQLIGHL
ncbi:serine/threonine-protein kinase 36 [Periophthalmus magnuspinnatus]|uniref:serine/threonine-protein kinase 36 n=1 Tax=Periophthalmus magnuspinnatus TaxID=409849 RepID=UPI00145A8FB9|nr:serine/threonine-protein kinase 36 [Periophthalmus magnuspinnatus]